MARPVKARSKYRQEQAEATLDRIADTARVLFANGGYATSMETIAGAAGVGMRGVLGVRREARDLVADL